MTNEAKYLKVQKQNSNVEMLIKQKSRRPKLSPTIDNAKNYKNMFLFYALHALFWNCRNYQKDLNKKSEIHG